MATFDQRFQTVHGNQVNAEIANVSPAPVAPEALAQLEDVIALTSRADTPAGRDAHTELVTARDELAAGDTRAAHTRLGRVLDSFGRVTAIGSQIAGIIGMISANQ